MPMSRFQKCCAVRLHFELGLFGVTSHDPVGLKAKSKQATIIWDSLGQRQLHSTNLYFYYYSHIASLEVLYLP
jgi:hypothetical protein